MGGGAGGGRQLVPEGGISYEWGGGGRPPPKPMLDPGLALGEMAKKTEPNSLPTQYGQRNQGL